MEYENISSGDVVSHIGAHGITGRAQTTLRGFPGTVVFGLEKRFSVRNVCYEKLARRLCFKPPSF